MISKNIGFSRTVYRRWLDATAALRLQETDPQIIRERLEDVLSPDLSGKDARRKTIDVLLGFWDKSSQVSSPLFEQALDLYRNAYVSEDFVWLHYGLGLLYYPIFRHVAATIGQMARLENTITRQQVKDRVVADWGHLGGIDRSIERICASLTEWGLLPEAETRAKYHPAVNSLHTTNLELQSWLLACALHSHPAEALLFNDLLHLPELFPFDLASMRTTHLAQSGKFEVNREGGWDMVRLRY